MLWRRIRPWLGLAVFVYELLQPLWHRPVDPLIVGGAVTMMTAELLARAGSGGSDGGS
jgi:hypothetical protein